MNRRVVITGMGAVTSLGIGAESLWQAVKNGQSGIGRIESIDISDLPTQVAAEIRDFDPSRFIDKKELKRMDKFSQYALAASALALETAALQPEAAAPERCGVIIGSGIGGLETLEKQHETLLSKGAGRISPFMIPMMLPNMAAGLVAIKYGFKGFSLCTVSACATSANAIGDAFRLIQRGSADVMLAGGAEAPLTRLAMAGFCAMKAMTTNPDSSMASRPFDAGRDGFVLGEGAGVLVLEEREQALRRGAPVIAEIAGYGCSNDAYHITAVPADGEGAAECMRQALLDADIPAAAVDYINAHGTSTPLNDKTETAAIKAVFGRHAASLPVSSTKSMTGHLLGAAGAIEAIITACALRDSFLPPTINYRQPDPECDLDYIPNQGRTAAVRYALTNSFGFGGHNASLVLKAAPAGTGLLLS
ncbi:MAG: beta-ketoacyl-ACP synthase II [Sporomusaceae bacterium]|nr:beta-ketoacyl-ACP synthase II [Sporomusaceae bacterium]